MNAVWTWLTEDTEEHWERAIIVVFSANVVASLIYAVVTGSGPLAMWGDIFSSLVAWSETWPGVTGKG